MKPPPFKFYAPTSTGEALELLANYGDEAKVLAGGQSLIPTMNFRLAQPEVLVDLNHIPELAYIRPINDKGVSVGAMTRQRHIERSDVIAERVPLLYETMPFIAHPQIRNRGTFGGSLAHADPAAELPAIMTVLGARFKISGPQGERWVAAEEFFVDLFETVLEPDELLVEVIIPPSPAHIGYAFREVSRRQGDYALVGGAAAVVLEEDGTCRQARLVYFSVGNGPVEAHKAVASLNGQKMTPAVIQAAAEEAAVKDVDPPGDIHASSRYRRHLVRVLAKNLLEIAANRVGQQDT